MRILRRNLTPLYLCKRKEVDGMAYFEDPVKIMVNNNYIYQHYNQDANGVTIVGTHTIVYDKSTAKVSAGDVLYYDLPTNFDSTGYDADLLVVTVMDGLNNNRAIVKEKWR